MERKSWKSWIGVRRGKKNGFAAANRGMADRKSGLHHFLRGFSICGGRGCGIRPPQWERCIVRLTSPEPIGYSSTAWYLRPPKIEPWRYHESPRAFRREWYIDWRSWVRLRCDLLLGRYTECWYIRGILLILLDPILQTYVIFDI